MACVTVPLSLTAFLIDQLHIVFAAQIHTWRNTLKMNAHGTLYPAIICNETWQRVHTHFSRSRAAILWRLSSGNMVIILMNS